MEAASSALSRGPSGAARRRRDASSPPSQMEEYARRAGGGRPAQPDGSYGQCVGLPRCRAAPPALCATSPPLRGREERARAMSKTCTRPRVAHGAVPRRTWGPSGRGGGAERGPGARGPYGCGSFGSRRLERSAEPVGRGALPAGIVPPSAGCRTRRLVRVTPARRAPPDAHPAGAGASDAPADPAVFFSPQAHSRPTHPRGPPRARIQDALPTPRGRDGTMRPAARVSVTLRSATSDPLRRKRLHAGRRVG